MAIAACVITLLCPLPHEKLFFLAPPTPEARGGRASLVATPVRLLKRFPSWICIHRHEGSWNDTQDPYWGGLQMDKPFMLAYGRDMIKKYKGRWADAWTPAEQIRVAERAYQTRGFTPWPNTARACGLPT